MATGRIPDRVLRQIVKGERRIPGWTKKGAQETLRWRSYKGLARRMARQPFNAAIHAQESSSSILKANEKKMHKITTRELKPVTPLKKRWRR